VSNRAEAVSRVDALLDAVMAVSSGLDLDVTLRSIVDAALQLVDARYGALGVVADDGELTHFVVAGIDQATRDLIGAEPTGKGLLGTVIRNGHPIRLDDLSTHRTAAGMPANHPPMKTFLGVPVRGRGAVVGRLYLTDKNNGLSFTAEDEDLVMSLAAAAGVAIDNSRLYEDARGRQRWLEASADVTAVLLAGSETSDALHLIASRAHDMTAADLTMILLPFTAPDDRSGHPGAAELTVAVAVGEDAHRFAGRRLPVRGTTSGAVYGDRVPRNVQHLAGRIEEVTGVRTGPALVLPMGSDDAPGGVLLTVRREGAPPFNDTEMQMVSSFADQAALALERAEVQTSRRELQALTERDRIATELHDHVIQRLFAVAMAMEGTQRRVEVPQIAKRLADHVDQLHQTILQIRSAIFDLRKEPAAPPPLRASLAELVLSITAGTPAAVTVTMAGPVDSASAEVAAAAEAALRTGLVEAMGRPGLTGVTVTVTAGEDLCLTVTAEPPVTAEDGRSPGQTDGTDGGFDGGPMRWSSPLA
jgi:GAF domain-containing protein